MQYHHTQNRLALAIRLLKFLDRTMSTVSSDALSRLDESTWDLVARMAGETRMPSEATCATVIALVFARERATSTLSESMF